MGCGIYNLTEVVQKYCIYQFNDQMKGFDNFFVFAKDSWNEILKKTLWSFNSQWLEVYHNGGRPYIVLPKNFESMIGLFYKDSNKKLIPIYGSSNNALIPKPSRRKKCECEEECNCGDLCASASDFSFSTKEIIINGESHLEKTWMQVCKNGDVKMWHELPAVAYDFIQEGGEFSDEFSSEFDIGTSETNETIEVVKYAETLCKLEVYPCGCVKDTADNAQKLSEYCACTIPEQSKLYSPQPSPCETTWEISNGRIYIIGKKISKWYLLRFREHEASEQSLVPDFCVFAIMRGIDYYSKAFNPRHRGSDMKLAKYEYNDAINKIIEYLNPIDLEFIYKLQSQPFKL